MPHFNFSPQFIQDFKKRNKITSRVVHFHQRPESAQNWYLESAQNSYEPILNCDETGFSILPATIKTWAFKKAKNNVVNVNYDLKNRISVITTISSDNQKFLKLIIAKADNEDDAMDQLGELINDNQFTFSNSSFMNSDCFIKYLYFLRSLYPRNQTIYLILDSYSLHISKIAKEIAQQLNITFLYIPDHFTDLMQPLDMAIFAPLKSIANAIIRKILFGIENKTIGIPTSMKFLQQTWEELPLSAIERAWEQYL